MSLASPPLYTLAVKNAGTLCICVQNIFWNFIIQNVTPNAPLITNTQKDFSLPEFALSETHFGFGNCCTIAIHAVFTKLIFHIPRDKTSPNSCHVFHSLYVLFEAAEIFLGDNLSAYDTPVRVTSIHKRKDLRVGGYQLFISLSSEIKDFLLSIAATDEAVEEKACEAVRTTIVSVYDHLTGRNLSPTDVRCSLLSSSLTIQIPGNDCKLVSYKNMNRDEKMYLRGNNMDSLVDPLVFLMAAIKIYEVYEELTNI